MSNVGFLFSFVSILSGSKGAGRSVGSYRATLWKRCRWRPWAGSHQGGTSDACLWRSDIELFPLSGGVGSVSFCVAKTSFMVSGFLSYGFGSGGSPQDPYIWPSFWPSIANGIPCRFPLWSQWNQVCCARFTLKYCCKTSDHIRLCDQAPQDARWRNYMTKTPWNWN